MSAEMDAVVYNLAEIESVGIEDGTVDVVADLRGSRGAVTMEGYDRYTGRRDFVEGAAFPVCPAGTVEDPVPSHLLYGAVVDDGSRAALPRAGFVWEDVQESGRWDTWQVSVLALLRRHMRRKLAVGSWMPRVFGIRFRAPCAAIGLFVNGLYVKKTSAWFFDGVRRFAVTSSGSVRNVVAKERLQREWKTAFSLLVGSGRVISFADYMCFRGLHAHEIDVRFCGRFEDRTTTLVPFYDFHAVPSVLSGVFPPLSLSVRLPRVAFYFGQVVLSASEAIRKRYERAYVIEWAYGSRPHWVWNGERFEGCGSVTKSASLFFVSSWDSRISSWTWWIIQ